MKSWKVKKPEAAQQTLILPLIEQFNLFVVAKP